MIEEEPFALLRQQLTALFLTEFIIMAPKETVDLLIKLGRNVEPSSLLSSLIVIDDNLNQVWYGIVSYEKYDVIYCVSITLERHTVLVVSNSRIFLFIA